MVSKAACHPYLVGGSEGERRRGREREEVKERGEGREREGEKKASELISCTWD